MRHEQLKRQFISAVEAGDVREVTRSLARHRWLRENINASWHHFDSPIILCARRNPKMIDLLLDAGADINARSTWWAGGFGILDGATKAQARFLIRRGARVDAHAAAHLDMLGALRELVGADPRVVHERGGDGQTPLHFASTVRVAKFLLDHGAKIDARDIDHESTPAQWMMEHRRDVARYLVSRGCKTDILMASAIGDERLVRKHLDAKPSCIRTRANEVCFPMRNKRAGGTIYFWTLGWFVSPHQVAKLFGHKRVLDLLMRRSPPDARLLAGCWIGDETLVTTMVRRHPGLVAQVPPSEIVLAARNNETKAVRLMLKMGLPADARGQRSPRLNFSSAHGATALHWAAWHGNLPMLKRILREKPPLDWRDADFDGTAIDWACHASVHGWHPDRGDYPACIEALIAAGAKVPMKTRGSKAVEAVLRRARARA